MYCPQTTYISLDSTINLSIEISITEDTAPCQCKDALTGVQDSVAALEVFERLEPFLGNGQD